MNIPLSMLVSVIIFLFTSCVFMHTFFFSNFALSVCSSQLSIEDSFLDRTPRRKGRRQVFSVLCYVGVLLKGFVEPAIAFCWLLQASFKRSTNDPKLFQITLDCMILTSEKASISFPLAMLECEARSVPRL